MAVALNHIVIPSRDKKSSATFLAEILGLAPPVPFAHFVTLETANGVSLDYDDADDPRPQHCAFLVTEEEFGAIFSRVVARQVACFADPRHREAGVINHGHGGRGFYFAGPDGHNMEVLTAPYAR